MVVLANATEEVREALGDPEGLLSVVERERARRFRLEGQRHDFAAARALVRVSVARLTGCPVTSVSIEQRCERCQQPTHGRPYVPGRPDLHVSWSHTHGYVAAAAGTIPVAVDVELGRRPALDPRLLAAVLTDAEIRRVVAAPRSDVAFLRQWVRKECLVKLGRATLDTLADVDLGAPPREPGRCPSDQWLHWCDGLHGMDWFDARHDVYGAVCGDLSGGVL